MSEKWEAFSSCLAVGSFTRGSRSFHRMLRGRECHISDVLRCDGKHPCTKFVAPRSVFHAFLMMFIKFDIRVRMTTSDCVSVSRWLFTWRHARSVSTHANTDSCTFAHTCTRRSSDVLPLGHPPPITCVRGRAAGGRGVMEAGGGAMLIKANVMLGGGIKPHHSLILRYLVSQPLTSSLNQLLIYLLRDWLLTQSGAT